MKTILVPTDFSDYSENALNFAMILAKELKAKIIAFHVVQQPIVVTDIPYDLLQAEQEAVRNEANRKMQSLSLKIKHAGGLEHECRVEEGDLMPGLTKCIEKNKVDLVIMGTKGLKNIESLVFGSTTEKLIKLTKCPVMAVPKNMHFDRAIRRITYATDYHKSDIKDILKLIEIASSLKAQVNILHISGDEIKAEQEVKLMSDFMHAVNRETSYNNMSFQILHGNHIVKKLIEFVHDGATDILVMATHHRTFFEELFNKSYTKQLIAQGSVPIIAFHYSANS